MLLRFRMDQGEHSRTGLCSCLESADLLPFRPEGYGEFESGPLYFTERRGLANWLLLATISGCGMLRYGGCEAALAAGRVAVIDCAQYQYYATSGTEPWRFFWMHFTGTAAESFVRMINGDTLRVADWEPSRTAELFDQLDDMARTPGRQTDLLLSLWIHQLLCELAQSVTCGTVQQHQEAMEEAAAFLREHLGEPVHIAELARRAGMSEFHFQRVFRHILGQSPYEYLTRLRVDRARLLLLTSEKSVAESASLVGYADVRSLIRHFKSREGCTPSALRKKRGAGQTLP